MGTWSEFKMSTNSEEYLNILERFAKITCDLVEKGFSSQEELTPVYDYIIDEFENVALNIQRKEGAMYKE